MANEIKDLSIQSTISNEEIKNSISKIRSFPYAFTEQGVAMLATVIRTDIAVGIIIDNKELYHCGASIKDLGKKCFAINKIEDISIIDKIVNE